MRKLLCIILFFSLIGCAVTTVTSNPDKPASSADGPVVKHIFSSDDAIKKLLSGISREEALALIGRTTTVGYELRQGAADEYQAVTVVNPHRSQQFTKGNNVYQVDYYLAQINKADGNVTEDELIPLVFESNRLIGKGWDFLNSKIKK